MSNKVEVKHSGFGFGAILFLIFLVLKLAEIGAVASWSWWWVTCPLWIPLALGLVLASIAGIIGVIIKFMDRRN